MPINLPDQQSVALGGSSIAPRDTFSMPGMDQGAERNAQALAKSLEGFGGVLGDYAAQEAQQKKEEQIAQIAGTVEAVRQSVGSSAVTQAQIKVIRPDLVPSVRALVAEQLGQQNAASYAAKKFETWLTDPHIVYDDAAQEQAFAELRGYAAQQGKDDPFYAAGVAKSVEAQIAQARGIITERRTAQAQKVQEDGIRSEAEAAAGIHGAAPNPYGSLNTKPPAIVASSPTATQFSTANPADINSPMKLAKAFIGQSEGRDAQVLSSFIKRFTGKNFNVATTPWCAAFVEAVLGQSGQKQLGSFRAADFARYGNPTTAPQEGDIVVLKPQVKGASGHVGFYAGKDAKGNILVLGGNQGGKVSIIPYASSEVVSYRDVPTVEAVKKSVEIGGTAQDFLRATKTDDAEEDKVKSTISTLTIAKVPVNNANLAVAKVYGEEAAVKLLQAADTALVKDVAPEAVAVTGDGNITVSQAKQKAQEDLGLGVDGQTATFNAIRATDQKWGAAGSLENAYRRDLIVDHFINKAMHNADPRWLDSLPPEWTSVPSIKDKLADARVKVDDEQRRRYIQTREINEAQLTDLRNEQAIRIYERLKTNPRAIENVFTDPDVQINGRPDPKLVRIAQEAATIPQVMPDASIARRKEVEAALQARGAGEMGPLQRLYGLPANATDAQVKDAILNDTKMMNMDDRMLVINNQPALHQSGFAINDPLIASARAGIHAQISAAMSGTAGMLITTTDKEIMSKADKAFDEAVKTEAQAWYRTHPGSTPTGADIMAWGRAAAQAAQPVINELTKPVQGPPPSAPANWPYPVTPGNQGNGPRMDTPPPKSGGGAPPVQGNGWGIRRLQ